VEGGDGKEEKGRERDQPSLSEIPGSARGDGAHLTGYLYTAQQSDIVVFVTHCQISTDIYKQKYHTGTAKFHVSQSTTIR